MFWVAAVALATPGVFQLTIETTTDSVLDQTGSSWEFYKHSQKLFGQDEIITVLIEGATPFDRDLLERVARLSHEFATLPGVERVDSLATVPMVRINGDGELSLDPPLNVSIDDEALERLKTKVWLDRIAPRTFVSEDGRSLAINLLVKNDTGAAYSEILEGLEVLLTGTKHYVSGVPVFRVATDQRTRSEIGLFVPLTIAAIGLLLAGVFRSLSGVVLPLVASGASTWIVAGVMGAADINVTIGTMLLPTILLANGCAYAVHILSAGSLSVNGELESAILPVSFPLALSGATTALGFVALSTVSIQAIRDLGTFGALGSLLANFAALTMIPAAMRLWPVPTARSEKAVRTGRAIGRWAVGEATFRGVGWMLTWGLTLVTAFVGMMMLRVETDVIVWFPEDDPVRVAHKTIRERLSGISPVNVVIEAPDLRRMDEPKAIEAIASLTAFAETIPQVGRAIAISDPLIQIHSGFSGQPRGSLPQDTATIAQYLLLLESTPFTRNLMTRDATAANVVVRVDDNSSQSLLGVARSLESWWAENGLDGYRARATGIMHEFARSEDAITKGQLQGFLTAFATIAALLVIIFRSWRLAFVAMVPNVVPLGIAFGAMGFLGVPLDAGTVVVGSLALGIAVDDTMHIVEGYISRCHEGRSSGDALVQSLERSVPPICFTTAIIAIGFLVLGMSGFTLTRNLGVTTFALMVLCLAAELLLLPPLLLRFVGARKPD